MSRFDGRPGLDRQFSSTKEYADREFDISLSNFRVVRDKLTGTDTEQSDYRKMMAAAEDGEIGAVVIHSISWICRSTSGLEHSASRLEEHGVELHRVSEGLTLQPDKSDPFQAAMFQLFGVFIRLEANMAQQRTKGGIAARQENEDLQIFRIF